MLLEAGEEMAGVTPSLLNPTVIEVSQIDQSSTQFDRIRRTPINRIARESKFTIQAQFKWAVTFASNQPMASQGGVDENQLSYAILRTKDLASLGKTLKRGDLVTKVEDIETQLYVLRVEYGSHYDGKFTLVKVILEDRTSHDG